MLSKGASRIIFPLDVANGMEAEGLAESLAADVGLFKVGLELFISEGPDVVRRVARDRDVFLDLKLHDISETVDRAVARACDLGVRMLTVHASGGQAMLERAAKRAEGTDTLILAVTLLTSLDTQDLLRAGIADSEEGYVVRLAKIAYDAGVRGFVCSPKETWALRTEFGTDCTLVTPGVRPIGPGKVDDQKRVATPYDAIRAGSDYLVIGRPIRDAVEPRKAAQGIAREIERALSAVPS